MTRYQYNRMLQLILVVAIMLFRFREAAAADCTTVTSLISACSSFVTYGSPDPIPGSPCCVAMSSLNNLADSGDNIRTVCRCLMDLINNYTTNATAIATLPGFCGVSLGFTIDPNTDCEYIDPYSKQREDEYEESSLGKIGQNS